MAIINAYDIAVIGGGASGLMAAIAGAKALGKDKSLVVLERQPRVGKKLLATGNGRCNISNINAGVKAYNGADNTFISSVLSALDPLETIEFFKKLGLLCRIEEDGRVYPRSNQANSVLDILRLELEGLGIEYRCDFDALDLEKKGSLWRINGKGQEVFARRVIVAAGGRAAPQLGGNQGGLQLAHKLGHTIKTVLPALSPVKILKPSTKGLQGIRARVVISLLADEKWIQTEAGELQFTEYGLSGICVFNLSRFIGEFFNLNTIKGEPYKKLSLMVDLLPEYSREDLLELLKELRNSREFLPLSSFLVGFFPKRIGEVLLKEVYKGTLVDKASSLQDCHLEALVKYIKGWEFTPSGVMHWANAQVSMGGVSCLEVNKGTLESLKVKGVYLAGELLDIDGPCGGYNLQWAWSSGYLAGISAAASLKGEGGKC